MNKKIIYDRIESDFDMLTALGYEVFGVFLQGSQNYNLDYEDSDIDTKAIVLPSFEDVVLNKKPISTTMILDSGEHIDIKDIRLMFENFKKQNINFVEILFTKYNYINGDYFKLYKELMAHREDIAHYNNYVAVKCIAGMAEEKYKAMEHPYPTLMHKINLYGYDPKQLHHILRCKEFLERYIAGEKYETCLIPFDPEYLIKVKKCPPLYNLEEARKIALNAIAEIRKIKEDYLNTHPCVINEEVNNILNNIVASALKQFWGVTNS